VSKARAAQRRRFGTRRARRSDEGRTRFMKIGIFTALFHDQPIEQALDYIAEAGIESVELGGGAYPGDRHLQDMGGPQTLVQDDAKRKRLVDAVQSRGLIISAVSVHGNPLHPNRTVSHEHHEAFQNAGAAGRKTARRRHHAPGDRERLFRLPRR
jgi:sugar phosphate isomerase/epimerase